MRILLVCQSYAPEWSGGSSVYVTMLAGALRRRGHEPWVLCASRSPGRAPYQVATDRHDGYPVSRISGPRRPYGQQHTQAVAGIAERLLAAEAFDTVSVHCAQGLGEGALLAASRRRVPAVVTLHDGAWLCPNNHFVNNLTGAVSTSGELAKCLACMSAPVLRDRPTDWARTLAGRARYTGWVRNHLRDFLGLAGRLVAICDFIALQYRRFGVRTPITTIRTRIPEGEILFKPARRVSAPLRLAALGAFRPNKGGPFLLRSLARLEALNERFQLDVWGPVEDGLQREAQSCTRKLRVAFHGSYERSALDSIFQAADVVVHPSVFETYPLTVLEALASRTPVIVPRSHGMTEMLGEGRGGWTFRPSSEEELAARVEDILRDPDAVTRMQAAMEPPPPYSGLLDEYLRVYSGIR